MPSELGQEIMLSVSFGIGRVDPAVSKEPSISSWMVKQVIFEELDPEDEGITFLRTSASSNQTQNNIPEDLNLGQHSCDNLKFRKSVTHLTKKFRE